MNCKLCETNIADKKNSHIISKFLGKQLFEGIKPSHAIRIGRGGTNNKIQDTIKEDYLFCKSCEKRMEILETYLAKRIYEILNYSNYPNKFEKKFIKNQGYLIANDINPFLFKLFVFLQVWRISISASKEFEKFKLPNDIQGNIQFYLNNNLQLTQSDLLNNIKSSSDTLGIDNCFIIPENKSEETRGIYTAYEYSKDSFLIMTVNLAIMVFTKDKLEFPFNFFSNKGNDSVKIFISNKTSWNGLNRLIVEKIIN